MGKFRITALVVSALLAFPVLANTRLQLKADVGSSPAITSLLGPIKTTRVCPGALATLYTANTTDKPATYNDNGTVKPNPATANSNGEFHWYVGEGTYDVLIDGCNVVRTLEDITVGAGELVFPVTGFGCASDSGVTNNTNCLQSVAAAIKTAGGGRMVFPTPPTSGSYYAVQFDDLTTQYYGLVKFTSDMTVTMEPGAELRVTGSDPAIFAGVFGPDITALPITNVKFLNINARDTISGTDPQLVRLITFTPTNTMADASVKGVEIAYNNLTGFASPILIASRNAGIGNWGREIVDVSIHHNFFYDVVSAGATMDGRNISFTNNHVYGQGAASYDGVSIHACDNCIVSDNFFSELRHPSGITLHVQNSNVAVNGVSKGTRNVVLSDNIIYDTYGASKEIGISVIGSSPLGTTNISAIDNTIVRGGRGIQVNQNGDIGSPFHTITITNNRVATHERGLDLVGNLNTKKVYDFALDDNIVQVTPSTGLTYLTGTVATMAAGGTALVGSGTLFLTELSVNDYVNIAGWVVKVTAIADDLNATVSAYPGQVAATGSTMYKYGAGVTVANSWGMRLFYAERGSASNNDILVLNGSTNSIVASLDGLRDVKINDNVFTAGDDTIVSLKVGVNAVLNRCTFSRNTFRGQSTWAAAAFASGFATQNQFRTTSGALFNGHEVGNSTVWGFEGSRFWRYGTSAPAGEDWLQYDEIINSTKSELGGAGSKYVIEKWFCSALGNPGTWLEQRTLTGN